VDQDHPPPRYGVEVDGHTVRAVSVCDGEILDYEVVSGADGATALSRWWAQARRAGAVTIMWAGCGAFVRSVAVPRVPGVAVRQAIEDACEAVMPSWEASHAVCGWILEDDRGGGRSTAVVGGAPRAAIEALWRTVRAGTVAITLPAFVWTTDGLYLDLRSSACELVFVESGWPRLVRELSCGGLAGVAAELSAPDHQGVGDPPHEAGTARLEAVMSGAAGDREAFSVVERFVDGVVAEVRATIDHWAIAEGVTVRVLQTHGPGVALPMLVQKLAAVGLSVATPPESLAWNGALDEADRGAAASALMAARSELPATASFANTAAMAAALTATARRHRARLAIGAVTAIGLAASALLLPVAAGRAALWRARLEHRSAVASLTGLAAAERELVAARAGAAFLAAESSGQPAWGPTLRRVIGSAPTGMVLDSLALSVQGRDVVTVSIDAHSLARDALGVEAWMSTLRGDAAVRPGTVFASVVDLASVPGQVRFTLRLDLVLARVAANPIRQGSP